MKQFERIKIRIQNSQKRIISHHTDGTYQDKRTYVVLGNSRRSGPKVNGIADMKKKNPKEAVPMRMRPETAPCKSGLELGLIRQQTKIPNPL